jgi:hypothetical protein
MVIKSLGNKSKASFGNLLSYVTRAKAALKDDKGKVILLKYNISGRTIAELKTAFLENEANRRYDRKGVNVSYQDIISFDPKDTPLLTVAMLEDITEHYLQLRGEACVAVAAYHSDKKHQHVHVILGGVECGSGKAIRVSKERFKEIKESLQRYQQERYPALVSIVNHGKRDVARRSENEYQLKARTGKASRKDGIKEIMQKAFEQSLSLKEFYQNISKGGLNTYERNGRITGIADNRHYRFGTLGYNEEKIQELSDRAARMEALEDMRGDKEIRAEIEEPEHDKGEALG